MAEQRDIQELVREVLQTMDTPEEEQPPKEGTERETEPPPVGDGETLELYLVTREELESLVNPKQEETVVEADTIPPSDNIVTPPPETTEQQENQEETEPAQPPQTKRKGRLSYILVPLVLLFVLTAGTMSFLFLLPLTATADITIVPDNKTVHKDATLAIATSPNSKGVAGRLLQTVNLSASKIVSATGHGHDDATTATGIITFYNGDTQPHTIPAGVSFQVNGVDIITTADVTIQAAVDPLKGEAIAPAQAGEAGASGNIPAHAFYTRCCSSVFITATNTTPFNGGRDARDYNYVQSSDIQNAISILLPSLTEKVTATLTRELHAGEQLVSPLCTPRTLTDHQPGEEATQVHVTVVQTCKSVAFNSTSLQSVATSVLTQSSRLDHYRQIGVTELAITKAVTDGRSAHLTISVSGSWVYAFSKQELTHFKQLIAGKDRQHAQELLQQEPGIEQITVNLTRFDLRNMLPTDPGRITIHFLYIVS